MILGQGPKVEQYKLIGYTLYKYIWKKKIFWIVIAVTEQTGVLKYLKSLAAG